MKYKKGTFVVVPNRELLRGKCPEYLAIYFWLISYADDDGVCFPARKKLAKDAGLTDRTIDKYTKELEHDGLITKTKRKKNGTVLNNSNIYQILIPSEIDTLPSETKDNLPSETNLPITIPNINYNQLTNPLNTVQNSTKEESKPYFFIEELEKLGNSHWKPDLIIYNYWMYKNFVFDNLKQFKAERSRNIVPARKLEGYSAIQIKNTMDYCEKNYADIGWTLETVAKTISRVVNVKK